MGEDLARMLKARVAYHHSGLSYALRAGLIEPLAKAGQLRVIVSTMGLAAGINFSVRSVHVASTTFHDGLAEQSLTPDELLQMFGRAGRRGLDERGYVISSRDSPSLADGRAARLRRSNRLSWPFFIRIMQRASLSGKSPFDAARDFAKKLFAKEPPDREEKKMSDYLKVLVDRDAWVFNLMYMLTFGGYIGLTSFLPTLFHDQYGIPKESIGKYSAIIIIMASILRVVGGTIADRFGGIRSLTAMSAAILVLTALAATIPVNPWMMVAILVLCFSAMGAANGAVFQLVPLRFKSMTAVAGSLVGEIGALAGGFLPVAMGISKQWTGSYAPGFLLGTLMAVGVLSALSLVSPIWTSSWVGRGGVARDLAAPKMPVAITIASGAGEPDESISVSVSPA